MNVKNLNANAKLYQELQIHAQRNSASNEQKSSVSRWEDGIEKMWKMKFFLDVYLKKNILNHASICCHLCNMAYFMWVHHINS